MNLHVLGSGSSGNCYLLTSQSGETLIVEAGIKFSEVKKALDFDLSKIAGCIVSHEHLDHAKYVREILSAGINVHTSYGTMNGLKLLYTAEHHLRILSHGALMAVGSFVVYPFNIKHDARQPLGFLIKHPEMGTTLFLTDTFYIEYKFSGLNNLLIEANYCDDILQNRIESGYIHPSVANRVKTSHLELQTLKNLLSSNDLSAVNNIVLIHLSDSNSDAVRFKKEVQEHTGKTVTVAEKHLSMSFNKTPF